MKKPAAKTAGFFFILQFDFECLINNVCFNSVFSNKSNFFYFFFLILMFFFYFCTR